ncbi:MAG: divalent-cation tolerance protein CutA [Candidatus Nezhaarchaeales archaeon]
MTEYIQVVVTTSSKEEAERIVRTTLEKRLVGCAQIIGPVTSTYWWQGRIEVAEEWLCLMKSRLDLYQDLEATIHSLHSYQVPEILAIPVATGSSKYLKWLDEVLKRKPP